MSKVVAMVKDAGSSGATTSAVSLAALLARAGRSVLLMDLDAQANASQWLGCEDPARTSGDVLLRECSLQDAVVDTQIEGLRLVPASGALKSQRVEVGRSTGPEQRVRLALRDSDADVVLIDCQAGVGELYPLAALVAATGVLTVAFPGPKEIEGVPRVEQMVSEVAEAYSPDLALSGVIPCAVPPSNRGRLYTEALGQLREAYGELVTPPVRQSVVAVESYDRRVPLPVYAPTAPVTRDYEAVLEDLTTRGVL